MKRSVTIRGITVGLIVGVITAVFTAVFHKSMPIYVATLLPALITVVAHHFGINFAAKADARREALSKEYEYLEERA